MKMTIMIMLAGMALCGGCCVFRTRPPATRRPLVVGERVLLIDRPDQWPATMPALRPPAVRWILADDVGMLQWMGLDAGDHKP